jgi:hypothetical protein
MSVVQIVVCGVALLILGLVAIEALLRMARLIRRKVPRYDAGSNENPLRQRAPDQPNLAVRDFLKWDANGIYYEDFVGYLQRPFVSQHFNLNSRGFRCPEFSAKKKNSNQTRVILLGSSALLGVPNCSDNETVSAHLQTQFDDAGLDVEVLNLGIRSYLIPNELNLLFRVNLELEYDVIVVFDGYNDIFTARKGNIFSGWPRVSNFLYEAWDSHQTSDLKWFRDQIRILKGVRIDDLLSKRWCGLSGLVLRKGLRRFRRHSTNRGKKREQHPNPSSQYDGSRAFYLQCAATMINFVQSFGGKSIYFCPQPSLYSSNKPLCNKEQIFYEHSKPNFFGKQGISLEEFNAKYASQVNGLKQICDERRAGFVDAITAIDSLDESSEIFYDYCHLTSKGNALVANVIFESLNSELGLLRHQG